MASWILAGCFENQTQPQAVSIITTNGKPLQAQIYVYAQNRPDSLLQQYTQSTTSQAPKLPGGSYSLWIVSSNQGQWVPLWDGQSPVDVRLQQLDTLTLIFGQSVLIKAPGQQGQGKTISLFVPQSDTLPLWIQSPSAIHQVQVRNDKSLQVIGDTAELELQQIRKTTSTLPPTTWIDSRDQNIYPLIQIGTQVWMTHNLRFKPSSGTYDCPFADASACAKWGFYYDWNTALTVCPSGFKLPDSNDYEILIQHVGESSAAELRSRTDWPDTVKALNSYGWDGLPGDIVFQGAKANVGIHMSFWTSTPGFATSQANTFYNHHVTENMFVTSQEKTLLAPVRCLRN